MSRKLGVPSITTSVRIGYEVHQLCQQHGIPITEAVRTGIGILLAERGIKEYDSNLNIMRRIDKLRRELEEKSQELERLRERVKEKA